MGFNNVFLLEPSKNFQKAAVEEVGLQRDQIFSSPESTPNYLILHMLDVIEHLPAKAINELIAKLLPKCNQAATYSVKHPIKNL